MDDERPSSADVIERWQDVTRAAELAERLTGIAAESTRRADLDRWAVSQVEHLTDEARRVTERAASTAAQAAAATNRALGDDAIEPDDSSANADSTVSTAPGVVPQAAT